MFKFSIETQGEVTAAAFTDKSMELLQSTQDCRADCLRHRVKTDESSSLTKPFDAEALPDELKQECSQDDTDEEDFEANCDCESLLEALNEENDDAADMDPAQLHLRLQGFSFHQTRKKGVPDSGMADDVPVPLCQPDSPSFIKFGAMPKAKTNEDNDTLHHDRQEKSCEELARLLLRRNTTTSKKVSWAGKTADALDATGTAQSMLNWSKAACGSDIKQRRAFEAMLSAFLLAFHDDADDLDEQSPAPLCPLKLELLKQKQALERLFGTSNNDQLVCLLHGPGGSGKSTVILAVVAHAKEFCALLGHALGPRTIVITAVSGVAATLLHGETTHSALGLDRDRVTQEEIDGFRDTRLAIIDETSFGSPRKHVKMHNNMNTLMNEPCLPCGGQNVAFAGDCSQLEPVKDETTCDTIAPEFHHTLNCFIELDGMWRFLDDPPWGQRLFKFRSGTATIEDAQHINGRCHVSTKSPPIGIQAETHTNKDGDAVDSSIFERFCQKNKPPAHGDLFEGAVAIFMDNLEMQNSKQMCLPIKSNSVKRHFCKNCSESSTQMEKGRCDSVLKLCRNCPLVLTLNESVQEGQANGSRAPLQSIDVKMGEAGIIVRLKCGTFARAFFASQIQCLAVKHEQDDTAPPTFDVNPRTNAFTAKMAIGTESLVSKMKGCQLPVVSSTCTAGHKLQGCSVASTLVSHLHYASNWVYVALSRVKTMAGLCLREMLSTDLSKCQAPQAMTEMLGTFRNNIPVACSSDDQHASMLDSTT